MITVHANNAFPKYELTCVVLVAILLRWGVSLYPYSGQGRPPMFGDYEAQRHWQEITLHIPVHQWYRNTTQNDLQYWGLDYPPLTAYHSLAMGHVAEFVDPESVVLFASRGYENARHKLFMRWTVFVSDVYFYVPAIIFFYFVSHKIKIKQMKLHKMSTIGRNVFFMPQIASCFALMYPGLMLIDYGHFQYNCVSLGLFVWATVFIILGKHSFASFFFVLALNYKQMELYHALPFFVYLLRCCTPRSWRSVERCARSLLKIGSVVIMTFVVVWLPFLTDAESLLHVVLRLFPLGRGVFEDKVANVWCLCNVFFKLKSLFDNVTMAKICLTATTLAVLPSTLDLFLRPSVNKFVLSLVNSSLSFFLFSYQVHEKSILLCAIPVLLHLPFDPVPCMWFLHVSTFSMLPLLIKDGLFACYISLSLLYLILFGVVVSVSEPHSRFTDIFNITKVNNILKGTKSEYNGVFYKLFNFLYLGSMFVMICLSTVSVTLPPPKQYPDLFALLISGFSCCNLVLFYIYFNYCQFIVPNKYFVVYKKNV